VHEYSIVQALIDRVEAEARVRGATGVHRLSIRLGELSGVEPELLTTAYDTFRERTLCEHARLDVHLVPARWECPVCRSPLRRGDVLTCRTCGIPARLAEGDEIMLDRIELEVP